MHTNGFLDAHEIKMDLINRIGQIFHRVALSLSPDKTVVALGLAILAATPVGEVKSSKNQKENENDAKGEHPNRILGETRTDAESNQRDEKKGNGNINDWKKFPDPRGLSQFFCGINGHPPHNYIQQHNSYRQIREE
jgi:hypothetical protein